MFLRHYQSLSLGDYRALVHGHALKMLAKQEQQRSKEKDFSSLLISDN